MTKRRVIAALCVLACFLLASCGDQAGKRTAYSSATVTIEREGNRTTVYDTAAGKEYTFQTQRTREPDAERATRIIDTPALRIEAITGAGLIVTDKAAGKLWYMLHR